MRRPMPAPRRRRRQRRRHESAHAADWARSQRDQPDERLSTWAASSDDVGVAGYAVYVNGSSVSTVTQPAATVSSLTCATTYTFEVDAYDAAGNRSSRAALSAASASCSAPPPPPPPADTTPPSKPILALGPQTQTTLELDWQAGVDNVGIDHYNVWLGHSGSSDFAKVAQASAAQLSYVYQGLTCATAYTLGLEAVDAAGNKSLIGEATWGPVSTLACSAPPPPPPPPPPAGDTSPPTQPANLGSRAPRGRASLSPGPPRPTTSASRATGRT